MQRTLIGAVMLVALATPVIAQERITPDAPDASILTTHDAAAVDAVPVQPEMPEGVAPFQRVMPTAPEKSAPAPAAAAPAAAQYKPKVPFGRGEAAAMPVVPSGPHTTVSVPVVDVDELEAAEPAPPTPIEPAADPVQENPEEPTELTSPIFTADANSLAPRKIILRALNKVTAQSAKLALKPGDKIAFGQLEITAVNCQVSSSTSQSDHAGLVDISEKMPADGTLKPLFRGWMYASSPSITALEHPIYDVTMVACDMMPAAPPKAPEPEEKSQKSGKKSKR